LTENDGHEIDGHENDLITPYIDFDGSRIKRLWLIIAISGRLKSTHLRTMPASFF